MRFNDALGAELCYDFEKLNVPRVPWRNIV